VTEPSHAVILAGLESRRTWERAAGRRCPARSGCLQFQVVRVWITVFRVWHGCSV